MAGGVAHPIFSGMGFRALARKWIPLKRFRDMPPVVGVVRLHGVIGTMGPIHRGLTLASVARTLERAFSLDGIEAVALAINSPGGSPVQSTLIHQRIRSLAREKDVRVFAFAEDVAASGGYMLALSGDEIFADASSIVGSIGVISAGFGFPEAIARLGIERRVHTAGGKKGMLDPFRPEDPDDVARLEAIQTEMHETFSELVRSRRGERLRDDAGEDLFSGAFWTGRRAQELGLIDGLGDLRSIMRMRYGERVRLRLVGDQRGWLRRRFLRGERAGAAFDWAGGLIAAVEDRAWWSRYGL